MSLPLRDTSHSYEATMPHWSLSNVPGNTMSRCSASSSPRRAAAGDEGGMSVWKCARELTVKKASQLT
eukprot:6924103-Prymnesium_polylepis.2